MSDVSPFQDLRRARPSRLTVPRQVLHSGRWLSEAIIYTDQTRTSQEPHRAMFLCLNIIVYCKVTPD